jgi:hypothetical protein
MTRGVARYLVGSLVVLGLAACGKSWLAERDAWRHEAEVACLKTGQVKETAALVRVQPITGPGICGADFPLKVSALGEGNPIGFADDVRPPGSIPVARQPLASPPPPAQGYSPYQAYPAQQPPQQYPQPYPAQRQAYPSQQPAYPPQAYPARPPASAPMSIYAPGVAQPEPESEEDFEPAEQNAQPYPHQPPRYGAPPRTQPPQAYPPRSYPQQPSPAQPAEQVPLGRDRMPVTTGAVAVQPVATLACPIVSALDTWFAGGVQPAAMKWFGVPVAEIKQISAYSCRGMNGQAGAKISEHAFGNALDIASFTLADGRKITVKDGWRGLPEEQGFLRDVHASACQQFSTVLAPGSNAFHYDHIHVDLMRRSSGRQVCNPAPIPGDQIAARAGYRVSARGEPGVTGSIGKPARKPTFFQPPGRDEVYDRLPRAVPGQD